MDDCREQLYMESLQITCSDGKVVATSRELLMMASDQFRAGIVAGGSHKSDHMATMQLSESSVSMGSLLKAMHEILLSGRSPRLELGRPWSSNEEVLDILQLAHKYNITLVLELVDESWSNALGLPGAGQHIHHDCPDGMFFCEACGMMVQGCGQKSCILNGRLLFNISVFQQGMSTARQSAASKHGSYRYSSGTHLLNLSQDCRNPNAVINNHGFLSHCICGQTMTLRGSMGYEKEWISSALGLAQVAARYGMPKTKEAIMSLVSIPLQREISITEPARFKEIFACQEYNGDRDINLLYPEYLGRVLYRLVAPCIMSQSSNSADTADSKS